MQFNTLLKQKIEKRNSALCIGLDPVFEKLPEDIQKTEEPLFEFSKQIIDSTQQFSCSFKPNTAFFEAFGADGIAQLKKTLDYCKSTYPDVLILLDAKRADIESTNNGYVTFAYDYLNADAITLHPYLGKAALMPFLEREEKGAIILCHTSNSGAEEFQEVQVTGKKNRANTDESATITASINLQEPDELYIHVARTIADTWNERNNCMLVVGATFPEQMMQVRKAVGDMPMLVPGIGAQGGDLEATMKAGQASHNAGLVIAASRSIIYALDPATAAKELHAQIQLLR